jgi:two-component system response regulator (stage 0 sporulation protein F)
MDRANRLERYGEMVKLLSPIEVLMLAPVVREVSCESQEVVLKKILVVDDEDNIRLLYQEELRDSGYEVSLAGSAEEALKIVEEDPPDLITLDVKLPGMSGFDFLKELKANQKDIPVILCSAYGAYKQEFQLWASEAYVVKSADLRELKTTIKEILSN